MRCVHFKLQPSGCMQVNKVYVTLHTPIVSKERITHDRAAMRARERGRFDGMKSSALIKCSGQKSDGSAPAPSARWVVCSADKCVAPSRSEWPSRHRLKQYLHSFIRDFSSPLQGRKTHSGTSVPSGHSDKRPLNSLHRMHQTNTQPV